jgi:hypothetical protein
MPYDLTQIRILRAPPERVYRALLDPAAIAKWNAPDGFTAVVHELDARVGGRFCISFISFASGQEHRFGGATGVSMERWSPGIALSFAMMLPMVWATGFDTGIVFCRRADFEALGGYDESRPIAEDVDFLIRLKRLGKQRGQHLRRLRAIKTITSTRKFDRHGDWHYFLQMPRVAWNVLRRNEAGNAFIRRYWYEDR